MYRVTFSAFLILFHALFINARPSENIPTPKYRGYFAPGHLVEDTAARIAGWKPNQGVNVWELSGLEEGDIMQEPGEGRNAMRDPESLWKDATIPYILEPTFTDAERKIIREGMDMIEAGSCFKFRPFKIGDFDFVLVQGAPTGCWSYVGKRGGGQVLNLQRSGCVHKGVVAHEFLHAAGFYHQQSAHDRDEYVFINFTNIEPGREGNFNKYEEDTVTDYGVGYDYSSVMHYSRKAFSKNGEDTIVPLKEGAEIGNRNSVSEKDLEKLSAKYSCGEEPKPDDSYLNNLLSTGSLVSQLF